MLKRLKRPLQRAAALLLCALLFLGVMPSELLPSASAAAWHDPYMQTMKQWGVMNQGRGDDYITRAEMAAVLTRAFGFTRTGPIPFTDVRRRDWFYDDIATTYNEGIFHGTSRTTASPHDHVTREQVLTFIGRCLRYEETRGEVTDFTDGQDFSNWSSIYVRSALLAGIISGRSDGSFRPNVPATRGEVAKMLSIGMGHLVNTPGVTELGGVFGNVTINSDNVTLRNTTIAGDLYLTGGVNLGNVVLDNVRVLGKIIVAGGGESNSGAASIQLNNVEAQQLLVDPATGQFVSLRAFGNTNIPETIIKCEAYIQDDVRNPDMGLQTVILDGPEEGRFIIAGNMKDVINKTPGSTLVVGDTGRDSVTKITVDEEAVGSHLNLEINAAVDEVRLDTATDITGTGDIGHLDVGANGCTSEILPDSVTVRPGVITEIKDMTNIDSEVAKELSQHPRILEGYPKVKNIAPSSADAYFSTNKAGTIYWALTDAAHGPLDDTDVEDLIAPPSYGSGFKAFGSIPADSSNKEFMTQITDLENGGTYYLSATLVDAHERRAPVKSQRILTPDGTVPAMANANYPTLADRTPTRNDENQDLDFSQIADIQATVMANKTCDLYYVLLAEGSTEPTTTEFLSASFADPFGYGRVHLLKNTMDAFKISEIDMDLDGEAESLGELEEKTTYDLYLWLTDADGEQSSQIIKRTITTKDVTPPEFTMGDMVQTATQANSVTLSNSLSEDGTVYWVAVETGTEYPKPNDGTSPSNPTAWAAFLKSDLAKLQVANGMHGLQAGSLTVRANEEFRITISGLQPESAYDVYYLAEDTSKNYSASVQMNTVYTLDETAPTATQAFESYPDDSPTTPYAYSTINVIFNEDIRYRQPSGSSAEPYRDPVLLNLYNNYATAKRADPESSETAEAERLFTGALRDMIILYDSATNRPVPERTETSAEGEDWMVDYRNVQVYKDGKNLVVSFVNNTSEPEKSSLNLESGARYYFHLQNITDNSQARNPMGAQNLPTFETVSAQVVMGEFTNRMTLKAYELEYDENNRPIGFDTDKPIYSYNDYTNPSEPIEDIPIDIAFTAEPRSTSTTADGVAWDMIFWFDTSVKFELFTRVHTTDATAPWTQVGGKGSVLEIMAANGMSGVSVMQKLGGNPPDYQFINENPALDVLSGGLNDKDHTVYDYALHFVEVGVLTDRSSFNQLINGQVTFVTGSPSRLNDLVPSKTGAYNEVINNQNGCTDITYPKDPNSVYRKLTRQFEDGRAPQFRQGYPRFTPTSGGVSATFTLDRPGTVYYVVAPWNDSTGNYALVPQVPGPNDSNVNVSDDIMQLIKEQGSQGQTLTTDTSVQDKDYVFTFPSNRTIVEPETSGIDSSLLAWNRVPANVSDDPYTITGLRADTDYLIYLVTQGVSDVLSPVQVYKFRTLEVSRPILTMEHEHSEVSVSSDIANTDVRYLVLSPNSVQSYPLLTTPFKDVLRPGAEAEIMANGKFTTADKELFLKDDGSFTLLDAMCRNVPGNPSSVSAGSLFDLYGHDTYKTQVANLIRGSSDTGNNSGVGGFSLPQRNVAHKENCDKKNANGESLLQPDTNYYFLAVGKVEPDSADAFSATYPVILVDNAWPKIVNLFTGGLTYTPRVLNDDGSVKEEEYLDGTISITFDKDLYVTDSTGSNRKAVVITSSLLGSPSGKDQIDIYPDGAITTISDETAITLQRPTSGQRENISFISFKVDSKNNRVSNSYQIAFNRNLSDSNGNRNSRDALIITIRVNKQTGEITSTFPASWDGRTSVIG